MIRSAASFTATRRFRTPWTVLGQFGEFVVVRGEQRLGARVSAAMCSTTAQASESPSYVAVPRPISSRMMKLRGVAVFRMTAVSVISTMNVERPRARLSEAPIRVKIRSISGSMRRVRGHPASHLRQNRDQRCLPQIRDLAAHIRTRDDADLVAPRHSDKDRSG